MFPLWLSHLGIRTVGFLFLFYPPHVATTYKWNYPHFVIPSGKTMGTICFFTDICPLMSVFTRKELQSKLIPLKKSLNKRQVTFFFLI